MRLFELGPVPPPAPAAGVWEGDLPAVGEGGAWFQGLAARAGADYKDIAIDYLHGAGAQTLHRGHTVDHYPVDAVAAGRNGQRYVVLCHGTPDDGPRAGLRRTDTVLKMGFRAVQLARRQTLPVLVVTSHLPERGTRAGRYLADLDPDVCDVIATTGDLRGYQRLCRLLHDPDPAPPAGAPWRAAPDEQLQLFPTTAACGGDDGEEVEF